MNVILSSSYKGWVLDGVVRDAKPFTNKKIRVFYFPSSRSKEPFKYLFFKYWRARQIQENDLVINQKTLQFLVRTKVLPKLKVSSLICHYTHDSENDLRKSGTLESLLQVKKILVLNKKDDLFLQELGVPKPRIAVIYGAIDRKMYFPLPQIPENKFILITGDAKERKNPEKIYKVIQLNPELNFKICGRYWSEYLKKKGDIWPNVQIVPFSLELNARLMREASTYLTLSFHEGGPYPVLEALASGTPVVATPVGWVEEIVNKENGRIVAPDATVEEISAAIRVALEMKSITYMKDLLHGKFTWQTQAAFLFDSSNYD
jgi:glycosyltransferase involved in cell wall biosynthesis